MIVQYADDRHYDTDDHDRALDKVIDRCGHVTAEDYVYASEGCHNDDADLVVNVECHVKESRETVIYGRSIGDKEDK